MKLLIKNGADVNGMNGDTSLHRAAYDPQRNIHAIKFLLENGADKILY